MQNIFANLSASDISTEPFPNLIKTNILDSELCKQLLDDMPYFFHVLPEKLNPGQKIHLRSKDALQMSDLPASYRDFLETHTGSDFIHYWLEIFKKHIKESYPQLEERLGKMNNWKVGHRYVDCRENADIFADAQISFHAPVPGPIAVQERGPHIKECNKLLICQLFMRLPQDTDGGGDFELYKVKSPIKVAGKQQVWNTGSIELAQSVKYESNTAIVFLNGPDSVQTMSSRKKTKFPVVYLNLILETREPIFSLSQLERN